MFTHYLVTRFNIKVSGTGPEVLDSSIADHDWFQARMKLFKLFCAPSVLKQTCTTFKWLIYFNPATSLEEIAYLKDDRIPVEFIFTEDFNSMVQDIAAKIKEAPTTYVICSRIDSDDAISSIYIEAIQNAFVPIDKTIINLNSGYIYESNNRLLTRWNQRFNNQFISLIEDKNSARIYTIYGFPHWKPPLEAHMVNIQGPPYWIYWRHSDNFSDQKRTGIPIFIKNGLSAYPLAVRKIPISWKTTVAYACHWFPRMFRRRLKLLFKSSEPNT